MLGHEIIGPDGKGGGAVAERLSQNQYDPHLMRPWQERDGSIWVASPTINAAGEKAYESVLVANAGPLTLNTPASLRKDEWLSLDSVVLKVARERLGVVNLINGAGLTFGGFNGYAKSVLEYQTQSDVADATVSMDAISRGKSDRPNYELKGLPLPITYYDFSFPARQIAISRNGGSPLDTSMAELAARKVAESIEKVTIGESTGLTYGGHTVYGLKNHPNRNTKSLTTPSVSNHPTTVNEVLDMIAIAEADNMYGPYWLLYGRNWTKFMGGDYETTLGQSWTLKQRLELIDDISMIKKADFLSGDDLLLIQPTSDVVRMVNGMDISTVQWSTDGGQELHFKVMGIQVPQIRADYDGRSGIVHGS